MKGDHYQAVRFPSGVESCVSEMRCTTEYSCVTSSFGRKYAASGMAHVSRTSCWGLQEEALTSCLVGMIGAAVLLSELEDT